jgi:hypothetical protein
MARSTVSCKLHEKVDSTKQCLFEKLKMAKTVNLTVDIWSDRKMRAFFGMTAHYISADHKLTSSLLSCDRFTGSHTGEKIAGEIDRILGEYQLKQKVDLSFWNSENIKNEYCQLYNAAIRVLSVPASSAAIERVFSQGGLIAVPHRVGMTDKTLSSLIFLKCNFNMNL